MWMWICRHFSRLLVAEGRPEAAARLLGAGERLRSDQGFVVAQAAELDLRRAFDDARQALGDEAFESARRKGSDLTTHQIQQIAELGIVLEEITS